MAVITLTVPDAVLPRVRAALCATAGLPDSNVNAKQAVIDHVKAVVRSYETAQADAARPAIVPPIVDDVVA